MVFSKSEPDVEETIKFFYILLMQTTPNQGCRLQGCKLIFRIILYGSGPEISKFRSQGKPKANQTGTKANQTEAKANQTGSQANPKQTKQEPKQTKQKPKQTKSNPSRSQRKPWLDTLAGNFNWTL